MTRRCVSLRTGEGNRQAKRRTRARTGEGGGNPRRRWALGLVPLLTIGSAGSYAWATTFTDPVSVKNDDNSGSLGVGWDPQGFSDPNASQSGIVLDYDPNTKLGRIRQYDWIGMVWQTHMTFSPETGVKIHAATFPEVTRFSGRLRLDPGYETTSGIWYSEPGGSNLQFAGAKIHSTVGANQEWGLWMNNAWKFWFRGNDNAYKYGSNTWTVASDGRLKHKVRPYPEGLASLEKIQPVWYQYNGKAGAPKDDSDRIGVIADDVQRVAPHMVTEVPNAELGSVKTVDTGAFTFMLINSVKELAEQNRELKRELAEQKRQFREELAELKRAIIHN